ncbi:MAG: hypothetical protein ACYS99_08015 [Planctomycetota bacterium]
MAKKQKAKKKKKEKDLSDQPRQEVDAVKGFIVVMIVLIMALGVFIVITMGKLSDYEQSIDTAKKVARTLGKKCFDIQAYLNLMKESGDTILIQSPERFFGQFYTKAGVDTSQVTLSDKKDTYNRKDKYTEIYWDLDIREINREQAAQFLWGVENRSPKARTLQVSMRRNKKKGEDVWDGRFRIGYRVAGSGK